MGALALRRHLDPEDFEVAILVPDRIRRRLVLRLVEGQHAIVPAPGRLLGDCQLVCVQSATVDITAVAGHDQRALAAIDRDEVRSDITRERREL